VDVSLIDKVVAAINVPMAQSLGVPFQPSVEDVVQSMMTLAGGGI
jgi:hypothetical protein